MKNRLTSHLKLLVFGFLTTLFVYAPVATSTPASESNHLRVLETLRLSAIDGSAQSQFELGLVYEYGRGLKQDDLIAAVWYEKSATQGYGPAQYRLAILCDNGWGKPVDKEKAFTLYRSAAEQGLELAQHDLAIAYFQGSGTARSLLEAYKWLKVAGLSGNPLMQKHLNMVSQEMTLDEVQTAEHLAHYWIENNLQ